MSGEPLWAHWGGEPFDRETIVYEFELTGTTDASAQGYSGPFHLSATFGSDGMSQYRAFKEARFWGENGSGNNTIDGSCQDGTTNDQRTVDQPNTVVSLSCTASIDGRDPAPITLTTVTMGVFVGNPGVPCVWGICVGPVWYTARHAGMFTSS